MRYALHPVLNLGETETVRDNFNDTPEALEKYYDSFREMFNTDGWQNLCNDFKDVLILWNQLKELMILILEKVSLRLSLRYLTLKIILKVWKKNITSLISKKQE